MSGSTRSPRGALIFPITATPSGTTPQTLPHQRNAFRDPAGEHSTRAECISGRRNAFRPSPESLPDFFRDRVDAFPAPEALRGVRGEITRTLAGRIQLRYRLVKVDPDPAHQPGSAHKLPEQLMQQGVLLHSPALRSRQRRLGG